MSPTKSLSWTLLAMHLCTGSYARRARSPRSIILVLIFISPAAAPAPTPHRTPPPPALLSPRIYVTSVASLSPTAAPSTARVADNRITTTLGTDGEGRFDPHRTAAFDGGRRAGVFEIAGGTASPAQQLYARAAANKTMAPTREATSQRTDYECTSMATATAWRFEASRGAARGDRRLRALLSAASCPVASAPAAEAAWQQRGIPSSPPLPSSCYTSDTRQIFPTPTTPAHTSHPRSPRRTPTYTTNPCSRAWQPLTLPTHARLPQAPPRGTTAPGQPWPGESFPCSTKPLRSTRLGRLSCGTWTSGSPNVPITLKHELIDGLSPNEQSSESLCSICFSPCGEALACGGIKHGLSPRREHGQGVV